MFFGYTFGVQPQIIKKKTKHTNDRTTKLRKMKCIQPQNTAGGWNQGGGQGGETDNKWSEGRAKITDGLRKNVLR